VRYATLTHPTEDAFYLIAEVIEIAQPHVLGFSMGGFIAQVLAFRYPERVKRLVLVSTAAKLPAVTQQILQSWLRMLQEKVRPETRMRSQFPWLFTNRFFENSQQVDELIRLSLQYPYPPTVTGFAGQVAACIAHDMQHQLHQITAPTLVLAGAEERLIPLEQSHTLAKGLPNAELKIVEEAGHNFFWERPELLNAAVLQLTR
jgi:3-oxoadipate enol-lactonase